MAETKKLTLEISNGRRAIDAIAAMQGYPEHVYDAEREETIANPQSREEFAKEKIADFIREQIASYERTTLMQEAEEEIASLRSAVEERVAEKVAKIDVEVA